MTSYEMICAALAHLETMPEKSMFWLNETCAYRAIDGNKCLIGALIPDHLYQERFEDKDAGHIARLYLPELLPSDMNREENDLSAIPGMGFKEDGIEFLNRLQECHDKATRIQPDFKQDVRESIRRRCLTWGMDFPSQEEIDAHRGMTI